MGMFPLRFGHNNIIYGEPENIFRVSSLAQFWTHFFGKRFATNSYLTKINIDYAQLIMVDDT